MLETGCGLTEMTIKANLDNLCDFNLTLKQQQITSSNLNHLLSESTQKKLAELEYIFGISQMLEIVTVFWIFKYFKHKNNML